MNDREIFMNLIKNSIHDLQDTIDSLYISCNSCTKNMLLNRLRRNVANLSMLVQGLQNDAFASARTDKNSTLAEFNQNVHSCRTVGCTTQRRIGYGA